MSINPLKRQREESEDELEVILESKKSFTHSLPFRASPTLKHTRMSLMNKRCKPKPLFTQTLTPADSEEEDSPPCALNSLAPYHHNVPSVALSASSSTDTDMDMGNLHNMLASQAGDQQDGMLLSPMASPRTLMAPQFDAMGIQDSSSTGRLPTPIYGHFQQSITSSMPEISQSIPDHPQQDLSYIQCPRSRTMPSPISEDEAMEFPDHSSSWEPPKLRVPVRMAQPLAAEPSQRGKIMFSMGFRADCDMCRNKVPGHSNHIFRIE